MRCTVSHEMVRGRRAAICQTLTDGPRIVTRGGTTYPMQLPARDVPHAAGPVPAAQTPHDAFDWDAGGCATRRWERSAYDCPRIDVASNTLLMSAQ
jgi:hypothetical protein